MRFSSKAAVSSGSLPYSDSPGGFEGRHPIVVVIDVGDLAIPHLELGVEANVGLDPAALSPGLDMDPATTLSPSSITSSTFRWCSSQVSSH